MCTAEPPLRVGVVTGSTRPHRMGPGVADWVQARAEARPDLTPVPLDLAEFDLPLFDEDRPPALGPGDLAHTRCWSDAVAGCDGFVFVVPEYNRSLPGALKNAIDFLFAEWSDKVGASVGYGVNGGARAVDHLRLVLGELSVAHVRTSVLLHLTRDFAGTRPAPDERQESDLDRLFDEVVRWGRPLRTLRLGNHR